MSYKCKAIGSYQTGVAHKQYYEIEERKKIQIDFQIVYISEFIYLLCAFYLYIIIHYFNTFIYLTSYSVSFESIQHWHSF